MTIQYFSEASESEIPNAPGLYAFFLDMLSPPKIGLAGRGPFSQEALGAARQRLAARIGKQLGLANHMRLEGEIGEAKPGGHLRRSYRLSAEYLVATEISQEALHIDLADLRDFAELLSKCIGLERPIYVGITCGQTFKQRYLQHKSDFYGVSSEEASFGTRFAHAGGEWDDLVFACIETDSDVFQSASLLRLERLVQSLTQPKFSLR